MPETTTTERDELIRQLASDKYGRDGDLEFDANATVSEGDDNGAYVQAWKWVSFSGTDLDKKNEESEEEEEE